MENNDIPDLTESQLDSIFKYISLSFETMTDDEKMMWINILDLFDPNIDNEDEIEDEY